MTSEDIRLALAQQRHDEATAARWAADGRPCITCGHIFAVEELDGGLCIDCIQDDQ